RILLKTHVIPSFLVLQSRVMGPLQETQSSLCLTSIILSVRFIFSLGMMISGRTRSSILGTLELRFTIYQFR
ncbi:MAG: hypothetical protein WAM26_10960, partial [Nitrososphaeraceae archaeon]